MSRNYLCRTPGKTKSTHCLWRVTLLIFLGLAANRTMAATTVTDWGTVPEDQVTTYYFSQTDLTTNFTDQYNFSLTGSGDSTYVTSVTYDTCTSGCGNAEVSTGIYYANGGLIDNSGSTTLSSGDYVYQVKGTGMGSGNTVDYNGSIMFDTTGGTADFVSDAPEPADSWLMLAGIVVLAWGVCRYKRIEPVAGYS